MLNTRRTDDPDDGDTQLKYDYEFDFDGESAAANILRMVPEGSKVLDIGAGPGSITSELKQRKSCTVTALDIDQRNVERLSEFCDAAYRADLNDPDWPRVLENEGPFDAVIASDVLEHLVDPWATLRRMGDLIHNDGEIFLSLPHVGHCVIAACLINEDFEYHVEGLLDRTHIRFFGMKNMQSLVNDAGLNIVDAEFVVVAPESTELAHQWASLPSETRQFLSSHDFANVYQVVVKAKRSDADSRNITLFDMGAKEPTIGVITRLVPNPRLRLFLRGQAKSLLSVEARRSLRKHAKRLGIQI